MSASKNSQFEYWWVITFEWCHKTESPFSIHVINPTLKGIVPTEWIQGKLIPEHRLTKLEIPGLRTNVSYSIFAKVQKGQTKI